MTNIVGLREVEQMSSESMLLQRLFDRLNKSRVHYAVLRNYKTLPYSLGGSDLDLLVDRNHLDEAIVILRNVVRDFGGQCISCINDYEMTVINWRFCGKYGTSSSWWGLPIDIFVTVGLRQYEHFDTEAVLSNSVMHGDVCVVSPGDAAIIAFLKECIANGKTRKNYEKDASMAYLSDKLRYKKILEKYFGTRVARLWGKYLTFGGDARTLKGISRCARWAVPFRAFFRSPLGTLRNTCTCIWRRWVRMFQPPGFMVAVTGTDGSGKSTIIHGIEPIMEAALHKKLKYEHLRPNLLPSIARLFGRPGTTGPVTDPHAGRPCGFLSSLARLLYYSLDYTFGYWFKVYPALVKKQNLYVFDRYYCDYLIDPRRSRIRLPRWLIKTVGVFIPQPDLILCLGTDPKVIHARKPELPPEEVERQVADLRQFCQQNRRAVWIDTGCSIEESVDKALAAITSRMAARYEKRCKSTNPDERSISWKVLLPVAEESRMLAMGLTPEELAGLSRSYRHIDVLPGKQKYDIVVIGEEIVDAVQIRRCLSCLSDGGTLAVVGPGYARCQVRRSGLACAGEYAALPSKQPRLFVPLASRKTREAGLSFHSPGSLRSKLWLRVAKSLSSAGVAAHLCRDTVSIWTASGRPSNAPSIRRWISEKAGWDVDEIVVYAGSDSPNRKITVLAMSSDCSRKIIARIADTDLARVAIMQESAALRVLAQSPLAGSVPALTAEGKCGSYFIQLQSCLPKVHGQCRTLSNAHIDFLSALSRIGRERVPLHKIAAWSVVSKIANSPKPRELPGAIRHAISSLISIGAAERIVDCHMTHGDFAPWNVTCQNNSLFVYDWEDSNLAGFPFHDVFHFIYRQASLVGPWPGPAAILKMMRDAAASLARTEDIRCDVGLSLAVWCIREYCSKPDHRLVDLATELGRMKHE